MVVFLIFGILLAGATGFDTLGLSPGPVSNLQFTSSPLPAEVQILNKHNRDCPQNELLVKILNILTNPTSPNYIDANTKTYVLSLLKNVVQNTSYSGMVAHDYNLRNNPDNAALRELTSGNDKKIKVTVNYEIPASNDCNKSLEYLHKIINALNEARTAEEVNFEMRTESPDKIPNENNNEDTLKALFDNPNTNIVSLLQNYRPEDMGPKANEKNDVLLERDYVSSKNPNVNYVPITYDYNVPKPENRLQQETKFLWTNPNVQPLNIDQSQLSKPNHDLDPLKALLLNSKQPQLLSSNVNVLKDLPKENFQSVNAVPIPVAQLNPNNYQNPNTNYQNNYDQSVPPVSVDKIGNYESNVQNGDLKVNQYMNLARLQYQPRVDYVNVRQTANHDNIVEITYVLQQPKTVHYEPVYLIKYRLPLTVFEETVKQLVIKKPYLKLDSNQLYQELLASLKVDSRFAQVTELRSEGIGHVNSNGVEKDNNVLRSKANEIEDELKIIKEINSNVSSSDLLTINNGTVENEMKRLKRQPVQKA